MQPEKKSKWLKVSSYATLVATILLAVSTQIANAQTATPPASTNIIARAASAAVGAALNLAYTQIGKLVFGLLYIGTLIVGLVIGLEAWLIGIILNISTTVFQSPVVQQGFTVTLSIANLGFVLGIIVIAIATILHMETYGYKKLLLKLVVAAILVNFSLVIAAPIFGFGNSITQYFLNCVDPGGGGCTGNGNGVNSMNDFAISLAGAFNPQKSFIGSNFLNANGDLQQNPGAGAFASAGQDIGKMAVPIFSIFFVGFELTIIVITLAILFVQLLIRYIYIAILAILMPFAWLGWVFPSMGKWWSSWWDKFIKQTFFAPIVVFFLYLAIKTANFMGQAGNGAQSFATYTTGATFPVWAQISAFFGNIFSPIIQNFLNIVVLAGLSIGGMYAADKMSIMLSSTAVNTVKSAAKGVGKFSLKQTQKGGRVVYQKLDKKFDITNRLREGRIGPLTNVPLAQRGGSLLGRKVADIQTNAAIVDEAAKNVPKDSDQIKSALRGDMNTQDNLAYIAELIKQGKYTGDEIVHGKRSVVQEDVLGGPDGKTVIKKKGDVEWTGQTAKEYLDANELNGVIERYGQKKLVHDADNTVLSNGAMRAAERNMGKFAEGSADWKKAGAELETATNAFMEKMGKGEMGKANVNGILGKNTAISRAVTKSLITTNPDLIPDALKKMNKVTMRAFDKQYGSAFDEEWNRIALDSTITTEVRETQITELEAKKERYIKSLGNNAMGVSTPDPTATPTPTPGPAPH